MGTRHVARLGTALALMVLLLPSVPALETYHKPACIAYALAANVEPPGFESHAISIAWETIPIEDAGEVRTPADALMGEGCRTRERLTLDTNLTPSSAVGILSLVAEAGRGGGAKVSSLSEASVAFQLSFEIALGPDCESSGGEAEASVSGLAIAADAAPLVPRICALLLASGVDPLQELLDLTGVALDVALDAAPFLAPAVASLHAGLAAAIPSDVEVAGTSVHVEQAPLALHRDDGGAYRVSGAVGGVASPRGADVSAAARAEAPHADAAVYVGTLEPAPAPSGPRRAAGEPTRAAPVQDAGEAQGVAALPRGERQALQDSAAGAALAPTPGPAEGDRATPAPVRLASGRAAPEAISAGPPTTIAPALAGGALALLAFALYQRVRRPEALENAMRAALHRELQAATHAMTAGELGARVALGRKTAEYHLRYLVRLQLVRESRRPDGATIFHLPAASAAPRVDPIEEALLALVRVRPGLTTSEAAASLALTRPRAERRLKDLVLAGRLGSEVAEGERRFFSAT